jgi:hypothetical protein
VPWSIGSHGRPIYIEIKKFGSLREKPDSVGSVILELYKSSKVPPRMVNLLDDDESDKEVEINVMKALGIDPADTSTREAPVIPLKVVSPRLDLSALAAATIVVGTEAVVEKSVSAFVNDKGNDGSGSLPHHLMCVAFNSFSVRHCSWPRHLPYQGPDVDIYIRYAIEVDVAEWMTELHAVVKGSAGVVTSASDASGSRHGNLPVEFENFDVEG